MLLRKFLSDSLWLSLGKFGTTLISFFLVPLYTFYLSPEEYGLVDLILTTSVLLVPIVTCQTGDALQTFLLKRELDGKVAFSNTVIIFIITWFISLLFFPFVVKVFEDYAIALYLLVFLQGFTQLAFGLNKGLDNLRLTSIVSIIESFVLLFLMLSLLAYAELGLRGFLLALLLSKTTATILYMFVTPIGRYMGLASISKSTIRFLLAFSLPLVPNMIGWWINNASDRYMINLFLGLEANGLYAVGSKIPAILNIVSSILVSSWHISALQNYERKRTPFFNKATTLFAYLFLAAALGVMLFKDPIFTLFVRSDSFHDAIYIIPLLTLGAALSAMSSTLGVVYLGEGKTRQAAYTTLIGGAVNIILNLILLPRYGLMGAAWGSLISFLVVLVIRYYHAKALTSIRVPRVLLGLFFLTLIVQCADSLGIINNTTFLILVFGLILILLICVAIFIKKTDVFKELKLSKKKS